MWKTIALKKTNADPEKWTRVTVFNSVEGGGFKIKVLSWMIWKWSGRCLMRPILRRVPSFMSLNWMRHIGWPTCRQPTRCLIASSFIISLTLDTQVDLSRSLMSLTLTRPQYLAQVRLLTFVWASTQPAARSTHSPCTWQSYIFIVFIYMNTLHYIHTYIYLHSISIYQ